ARRSGCARGGGCRAARRRAPPRGARPRGARFGAGALLVGADRGAAVRDLRGPRFRARGGRGVRVPRTTWGRLGIIVPLGALVVALILWRGPDWNLVADAFQLVSWQWVVAAIALNLFSVVARAVAWDRVIEQAMPPPLPRFRSIFSAFGVGLFANAVLPGRIGELARVAVLTRRQERRGDAWATILGTVFAHRVFDLFPTLLLVAYVVTTAKIPHWALTSLLAFLAVGFGLFAFALASARRHHRSMIEEAGRVRRLVTMARHGLGVLRAP